MKRFMQLAAVLIILLLSASAGMAQTAPRFQAGDVFAAVGNGMIQWYRNGALVNTLQMPEAPQFNTGMAFDAAGNLYATGYSNGKVTKFDITGNSPVTFASGLVTPESIVFDSTGNAYVGQSDGTRQVVKFSSSGAVLSTFSPAVEGRGTDWVDLAADQKTLYYTSEGKFIKRFDTSTEVGTQLPDLNSTALPGPDAFALRVLPNGNVLVADSSAALQLDTTGAIVRTYNPCDCSSTLFSLNLDPDGLHFWVGDSSNGKIYQVRIADGFVDQTINSGFAGTLFGVTVFGQITSSNTANIQFTPSTTPQTRIATIGNPADPAAQSLALTLPSVTNALNVSVTFFYEPTDLSTGSHGVGIADGVCELGATEDQDFDCRLATAFTYPDGGTLTSGDKLVPHIIPSHNNLGVWLRVIATRVSDGQPAQAGVDYGFGVDWYYAWNTNPILSGPQIFAAVNTAVGVPNPEYPAGWNEQNPQMYDRPGENPDPAFVKNITTYLKNCAPNCVGTADPGLGGKTITLNDIVAAAPPKSPTGTGADVIEVQVPFPNVATFPYYKGSPMLVAFEIENPTTDQSDPTAVTAPHSVNVSTLEAATGKNVPVQYPRGFPTTVKYNATTKSYYIFLSPAPYKADGTVYTLQINSDLLAAPKTANFVVKRDQ